jgi:hypothetical protein
VEAASNLILVQLQWLPEKHWSTMQQYQFLNMTSMK